MPSKAGVIFCALFFFISPAYADFLDASDVYKKHLTKEVSGVYYRNNYIFVIADIEITNIQSKRFYYEGKAMLKTLKLLKHHIVSEVNKACDFNPQGSEQNSQIYFTDFNINKLKARILFNRKRGNHYRRVTSFDSTLIGMTVSQAIKRSACK